MEESVLNPAQDLYSRLLGLPKSSLLVLGGDAMQALKELTPAECRRMIQSLLSVGDLPSELRSMILTKSQGNPLFVEEVI